LRIEFLLQVVEHAIARIENILRVLFCFFSRSWQNIDIVEPEAK